MRAQPTPIEETSEVFFIAIPKQSYMDLMEKARQKQTTVAVLLQNALKYAIER